MIEEAGFPAVATSSAAVAEAIGYSDHEAAPAEEMFAANARIARAVSAPVTIDSEAGYGLAAEELVQRLITVGASGCNLEDTDHREGGLVDVDRQADRLAAVRTAADSTGVPLVINARVDVFIHAKITGNPRPETELVEEALERGRRYLASGADCVFPIMATDPSAIGRLTEELDGPVNVLLTPNSPVLSALAELGVARVSLGPGLFRKAEQWLRGELRQLADSARDFQSN
jgi:2-methylisocitrate lyase-like PEP mutase family enzyme